MKVQQKYTTCSTVYLHLTLAALLRFLDRSLRAIDVARPRRFAFQKSFRVCARTIVTVKIAGVPGVASRPGAINVNWMLGLQLVAPTRRRRRRRCRPRAFSLESRLFHENRISIESERTYKREDSTGKLQTYVCNLRVTIFFLYRFLGSWNASENYEHNRYRKRR